jgi:hypothetical protein
MAPSSRAEAVRLEDEGLNRFVENQLVPPGTTPSSSKSSPPSNAMALTTEAPVLDRAKGKL